MQQRAIFLMWVSGSGKTTIQPGLLAMKELDLVQVNTTITRPMRLGEIQGEFYDFVSDERFEELKRQDDFIEYALVHQQYYYGTRKSLVDKAFATWKNVLKQVDIHGREQIMAQDNVRQYSRSVFMDVSDETMRERILQRDITTSKEDIHHRLESAHYERLKAQELCDVVIYVDGMSPEEQLDAVKGIIIELLE